jgi:CheY-like chemotaxis protein
MSPATAADRAAVLIVDDDPDIRELLRQFLEVEGFRVISARNGLEAIEQLRDGSNTCVILLDLMMPVMNGWQFRDQQKLDPALSHIPVVVISAVVADQAVAPIDADAYLRKPLDLDYLLSTVRTLCGSE